MLAAPTTQHQHQAPSSSTKHQAGIIFLVKVIVIGAGAFGGWTALELVRRGANVTLLDAWGPGHVRASSGGETRIIRATYGSRSIYTSMARRALAKWREHDERFDTSFYRKTGAIWMFGKDDAFGKTSAAALEADGQPIEWLAPKDARRRYPQINFSGIRSVLYEPEAGYLLARRACEDVVARVVAEGGAYAQAKVGGPIRPRGGRLANVRVAGIAPLEADAFVFACGPWLGGLFPDVIGRRITPTRQDVYYFGTPAGDPRYAEGELPIWLEVGDRLYYGIPGNAHRGFKISDDTSGPRFDPTSGERTVLPDGLRRARAFLKRRFPELARAPLTGTEVCQYEATPDSDYILDRHPAASNVWIAGGGSGHGFKMGPVIGETLANAMLDNAPTEAEFSLARFARRAKSAEKWT